MRWFGWMLLTTWLGACSAGRLEAPETLSFPSTPVGTSALATATLRNPGGSALAVSWTVTDPSFEVLSPALTLAAGQAVDVQVRFTPRAPGRQQGSLEVRSEAGTRRVNLSGAGAGAVVAMPARISLGIVALVEGAGHGVAALPVRNVGTPGSTLKLLGAEAGSPELGLARPAHATLAAGEAAELSVEFTALTPGPFTGQVTVLTDDPVRPRAQVEVVAVVEPTGRCSFPHAPPVVEVAGGGALVELRHEGHETCQVESVEVVPDVSHALYLGDLRRRLPLRLGPGEAFQVLVHRAVPYTLDPRGVLRVRSAGGDVLELPVRRAPQATPQVQLFPQSLEAGLVATGCLRGGLTATLYNLGPGPVVFEDARVLGDADFGLQSMPVPGTALQPGGATSLLTFGVRFRPTSLGTKHGVLAVRTSAGEYLTALVGQGNAPPEFVDRFVNPPLPMLDVVAVVDTSPSFASMRAGVRKNIESMLRHAYPCLDVHWLFLSAEGQTAQGMDAGFTEAYTPRYDGVDAGLKALDAIPVASEVESCLAPASRLASTPGLFRPGASRSLLCITDAFEQAATPAAMADQVADAGMWFSAVVGLPTSTCSLEAPDDGTLSALVRRTNGVLADVCDPDWAGHFIPMGLSACGYRTTYYLTQKAIPPIEVRVNGVVVPAQDQAGNVSWTHDAATNAIVFSPLAIPGYGTTVEVRAQSSCLP